MYCGLIHLRYARQGKAKPYHRLFPLPAILSSFISGGITLFVLIYTHDMYDTWIMQRGIMRLSSRPSTNHHRAVEKKKAKHDRKPPKSVATHHSRDSLLLNKTVPIS